MSDDERRKEYFMNALAELLEKLLMSVFVFLFLVIAVSGVAFWFRSKLNRKHKEENDLRDRSDRERQILANLTHEVSQVFAVDLAEVDAVETQNEIVRIVGILAHRAATACVNQVKSTYSDYDVRLLKLKWAEARRLALKIAPELAERLPHFSEYEPLKSSNAEQKQRPDRPAGQAAT
jgi:hypothetical protein